MVEDANVPIVLTHQLALDKMPAHQAKQVVIDQQWSEIEVNPKINPHIKIEKDELAYVIYTSGSTGKPKGTMVPHQGIVNRLLWMQEVYQLDETDHILQKTPYSFDVSVWEFFWPLMTGSRMVIAKPEGHKNSDYLMEIIQQKAITTLHFVPSMLGLFLEADGVEDCTSIRRVICSGEALPMEYQRRFFERSTAELHNLYGPTEAAVDVTWWHCQPNDHFASVPIGKTIANTQIYILDSSLNPVPIGVPGELHIGGVQLARGYHNRPDLTAEKFIPDPFSKNTQDRLYKTGDLCRFLADGNVEYIGRIDFQVKLRGLRIELGEIENAIAQQTSINDVAVLVREDIPGDQRLVAYVIADDFDQTTMNTMLKKQLPEFMIPNTYLEMNTFPLSPNGKLDRKQLPKPEGAALSKQTYVAPETEIQKQLVNVWETLFEHSPIGIQDNFFELGGHSLLAVKMLGQIKHHLKIEVPLSILMSAADITSLAQAIEAFEQHLKTPTLIPLNSQGQHPPLFCIHAVGGYAMSYQLLAQHLGHEQPVYALESLGLHQDNEPQTNVEVMATTYIDIIKQVQPDGPYQIAGHSFGGLVAYEMAQQLNQNNETVKPLILLDTLTPEFQKTIHQGDENNVKSILDEVIGTFNKDNDLDLDMIHENMEIESLSDLITMLDDVDDEQFSMTGFDKEQIKRILQVSDCNQQAGEQYQVKPSASAVILLRAQERPEGQERAVADTAGWDVVVGDSLQVIPVAGSHMSMLQQEHIDGAVIALRKVLLGDDDW